MQLTFLVVGGGIAGLTTALYLARSGHKIIVLESSKAPAASGTGIQLTPNATRVLLELGLADALDGIGAKPSRIVFRRYASGAILGTQDIKELEEDHGAPYYGVQRGQLVQCLLHSATQNRNIELRLGAEVRSVQASSSGGGPCITLAEGMEVRGDVVIGADGIRSVVRQAVTGSSDKMINLISTSDAVYRGVIPTHTMLSDLQLAPFVNSPEVTCWLGPDKHVVGYCIDGMKEYSIALVHPDPSLKGIRDNEERSERLKQEFEEWDPRIIKLLGLVGESYHHKLVELSPLESWVDASGRIALVGDACHSMLPHQAQGAAMAMEDAAVIGHLFSEVQSSADVERLLHAFQHLRYKRCSEAQRAARANRGFLHLADGDIQKARDLKLSQTPISRDERKALFDYNTATEVQKWKEARIDHSSIEHS